MEGEILNTDTGGADHDNVIRVKWEGRKRGRGGAAREGENDRG